MNIWCDCRGIRTYDLSGRPCLTADGECQWPRCQVGDLLDEIAGVSEGMNA